MKSACVGVLSIIHENPFGGNRADMCGQTDGREGNKQALSATMRMHQKKLFVCSHSVFMCFVWLYKQRLFP